MEENKKQKEDMPLGYSWGYKKEIDNTPKKEAKVEFQSASDKRRYGSGNLIIVVTALAVVIISSALLWAIYSVIHTSHLSELAGMHLTRDAEKTAVELINKKTTEEILPGYENWQDYKNDFLELKYPPEWITEEKNGEVVIRKFNKKTYGYFDSLALSVLIKPLENPNNLEVLKYLEGNNLPSGEKKQMELDGKNALDTGISKNVHGLTQKTIYYPLPEKIMQLDGTFYNSNYEELLVDFDKIVASIKFL